MSNTGLTGVIPTASASAPIGQYHLITRQSFVDVPVRTKLVDSVTGLECDINTKDADGYGRRLLLPTRFVPAFPLLCFPSQAALDLRRCGPGQHSKRRNFRQPYPSTKSPFQPGVVKANSIPFAPTTNSPVPIDVLRVVLALFLRHFPPTRSEILSGPRKTPRAGRTSPDQTPPLRLHQSQVPPPSPPFRSPTLMMCHSKPVLGLSLGRFRS